MNTEKQSDTGRYGIKDIYEASLKAAVPMDIMGIHYDIGDTILYLIRYKKSFFKRIKMSMTRAACLIIVLLFIGNLQKKLIVL